MTEINGHNLNQKDGRSQTIIVHDAAAYAAQRRSTPHRAQARVPVSLPVPTVNTDKSEQHTMAAVDSPHTSDNLLPTTPVFAKLQPTEKIMSPPSFQSSLEFVKPIVSVPATRRTMKSQDYTIEQSEEEIANALPVEHVQKAIQEPKVLAKPESAPSPAVLYRNVLHRQNHAKPKSKKASFAKLSHTVVHRKPQAKLVPRKSFNHLFSKKHFTTVVIVLILAATGYVMYDTLRTNNQLRQQATVQLVSPVSSSSSSDSTPTSTSAEGKDETTVQTSSIDSYKVAADLPRVITIPKINVRARVLSMTVNADGSLQAPRNIFDAGWYSSSARPGTPGAVAIDGHSSGATHEGLLGNLDKLVAGDMITVERGDGTKLNYKVTASETLALDKVDMTKFLSPQGTSEGLNIMTCTGKWINNNTTMDHRIIVYAKRV